LFGSKIVNAKCHAERLKKKDNKSK